MNAPLSAVGERLSKNPAHDCSAPRGGELTVDDALAAIRKRPVRLPDVERIALFDAQGRILAADVIAPMDTPPYDSSAVDGFAVFSGDVVSGDEAVLPIGGRAAAGHPLGRPARRGEAIRILTGAPMPDGADSVVMQEDCTVDGSRVRIRRWPKPGTNRRRAGEDVRAGDVALAAGKRLRPQELALAASLGVGDLAVRRRLPVAVFSTGDELTEPNARLGPGKIYDANRPAIAAMLSELGCRVTDLGVLADDEAALRHVLDQAAMEHDLIVSSGGMSGGDEDHVKAAVNSIGEMSFWRIAMKPGRPIGMGRVRDVPFLGLPGNPAAAITTFMVLGRPLVRRLAGAMELALPPQQVQTGFTYRKRRGRREYVRVRLRKDETGHGIATLLSGQGSHMLSSLVAADGLVTFSEPLEEVPAGTPVEFLPFGP